MRARTLLAVLACTLLVGAAAGGGAFLVGKRGTDTAAEAAHARAASERVALRRGRARNARTLDNIRVAAGGPSAKRGRAAGARDGEAAGQQEIAARGAGPTVLPLPVLPSNLYDLPPSGFTERPASLQIGNHSRMENISWSSWSDNASGSGTLIGNDCEPSCAEGSETRTTAQLAATDPASPARTSATTASSPSPRRMARCSRYRSTRRCMVGEAGATAVNARARRRTAPA